MDTTLRDGEQTSGVAFSASEKLAIARKLIEQVKVDRIEIASARVSEGEFECVKRVCEWAAHKGCLNKIEVLGFCDNGKSTAWICEAGAKVINLLTKGSERHCRGQLGLTPQQHIDSVVENIRLARRAGLRVNVYLEDWSNGIKDNPQYVFDMVDKALLQFTKAQADEASAAVGVTDECSEACVDRIMLPDTLGILSPDETKKYVDMMVERYPNIHFDFHAHNDYDLAAANVLAAVEAGAKGVHVTVNGLGERAGNASLSSVVAVLNDMGGDGLSIDESTIGDISRMVESYSGMATASNTPIVGNNAFTQTAGVHADGDKKGSLYVNRLLPERFGRSREYALGKMSGKANIEQNLKLLGIELNDDDMRKVTKRINELGDKKETVTVDDLPFIVSDVLHHNAPSDNIHLLSYMVSTAYGLHPQACVKLEINGEEYEESATGDGMYDAFVRAIRHIYRNKLGRTFPWLTDYRVTIPPGGRTDALVQTAISWEYEGKVYRTRGLDADQTEAAIKATIKMLNLIEKEYETEHCSTGR